MREHLRRGWRMARRAALAVAVSVSFVLVGCSAPELHRSASPPPDSNDGNASSAGPLDTAALAYEIPEPTSCGSATARPDDADGLQAAFDDAEPGAQIVIRAGVYAGNFVVTSSGTEAAPIVICADGDVALEGEGPNDAYGLHLGGVSWVTVVGLEVRDNQKGIVVDGSSHVLIEDCRVHAIGDEAIHLRGFTTDSAVVRNTIWDTGSRREKFGEGVYIGTAQSNWGDITGGAPDASDQNLVARNDIRDVTAEAVDIKEGTSGGFVVENTFLGDGMTEEGADSWVDVKGRDWVISSNAGSQSRYDGFQTHEIVDGWGTGNVFSKNRGSRLNEAIAAGDDSGFLIAARPTRANVALCDNVVDDGSAALSNLVCLTR